MKKLIIFFLTLFLFANENLIINLIGKNTYKEYKNFIQTTIKDKNLTSLEEIITFLKENGLIKLFFNKPKLIHPTFIFINNNPLFNTKTLYDSLNNLGYFYFYPSYIIKKDTNYVITLEMQSTHFIDPINFIEEIKKRGCKVFDIKKDKDFKYFIDCSNEKLLALKIYKKIKNYLNIKGVYWFNTFNFSKIKIITSKYDKFHPYILFYDKNLNLLNIISNKNIQKQLIITLPQNCKYIRVSDYFTKENIKRGIFIKGIE